MLNNTLYIFPTSRAIREYISNQKSQNQLLNKSITISEFFSRAILSGTKTLINKDLRILYLKEAIQHINIEKLGLNSNFSKFYNQSEYIFKFFNELNSEFKTIDELKLNDTYALYEEHLDILKNIYEQYIILLSKNNFVDNITLPLNYKINNNYLKQYEKIVFIYEGYLSSFEFKVIQEIALVTNLQIKCSINQFNQKNIFMFLNIGIELETNFSYLIDLTNHTILQKTPIEKKLLNHKIYPVEQRITQIAFIKYAITDMISNNIEPSKIIVLLPDESFASYLKLFDDEHYFNFAMGNNINNSILMQKTKILQSYIQNKEPKDEKKIEYFNMDKNFIQTKIIKYWNEPIKENIFFEILDFLLIDELNKEILDKVVELKLSLTNLLFKTNELSNDILLKDGYKILLSKLNNITLDDTHGGVVTVLGILETRDVQYDGVIIVDFNDDKIPKRSVKDKFISTQVKKYSNLPTLEHRQDLQRYYYKKLLDGAKQISISYVNDEQNTISRFAKQLFEKQNIIYKDFSSILKNSKNHKYIEQDVKLDINLSLQQWSATSLKYFLQCKRKYYLNYILNIKEHDILLKPAGYEVGQIIHKILEKLYKNGKFSYENLVNEISTYQGSNPYLTLDLEIWKKKLIKFFKNDIKRLNSGITINELEKPFKLKYKNITIKGTIDRIDKLKDNSFAILDYKTSTNLKIDTNKTYEKSVDFQLEFYFLALRDKMVSKVGYYDLNSGKIYNETMLNEKIKRLDDIFKTFDTTTVDFKKCEDKKECLYCIYKTICNRE